MSQLSPQDLQSLQQLIGVIAPKIIERIKDCEATITGMTSDITDLQEQVKILHTVTPKAEKPERAKRGSKKKEVEVPQLLPQVEEVEVVQEDTVEENPLSEAAAGAVAGVSATGSQGAGIAVPTQNVESEAGSTSSVQNQAAVGPVSQAVNGQIVYGVQYIVQQGFTDATVIAQALSVDVSIVQAIMNMSLEEQAAHIEAYKQQA